MAAEQEAARLAEQEQQEKLQAEEAEAARLAEEQARKAAEQEGPTQPPPESVDLLAGFAPASVEGWGEASADPAAEPAAEPAAKPEAPPVFDATADIFGQPPPAQVEPEAEPAAKPKAPAPAPDASALEGFDLLASAPLAESCLLYTSPSPRDKRQSRMPSSA